MKQCVKCGVLKPVSEYHKAKGCKDGTRHTCKQCIIAKQIARQTDNESYSEYHRQYYQSNKPKWKRSKEQQDEVNRRRRDKYANDYEYREKQKSVVKSFYKNNPSVRKTQRLRKYGVTVEEFKQMMVSQNNSCAICGYSDTSKTNFFPMVDHCHNKGHVRGILCSDCNFGLGKFKDNPELMIKAAQYIIERRDNATMGNMV